MLPIFDPICFQDIAYSNMQYIGIMSPILMIFARAVKVANNNIPITLPSLSPLVSELKHRQYDIRHPHGAGESNTLIISSRNISDATRRLVPCPPSLCLSLSLSLSLSRSRSRSLSLSLSIKGLRAKFAPTEVCARGGNLLGSTFKTHARGK